MEDKTPIYLLSIVGIVALVAVVYLLTGQSAPTDTSTDLGSTITGNIVNEDVEATPINMRGIGRFLVGVILIGSCVYMYKKWE